MNFYKDKNVLVTGGTGLIGQSLTRMLLESDAKVSVASLNDGSETPKGVLRYYTDLTDYENCLRVSQGMDYVFHLAGIKSNPKRAKENPVSALVPMLLFDTNMIKAAREQGVERYLYTSSVGVYPQAEVFHEDDALKEFPSPNDRFAGWAKITGELQAEAYRTEFGWDKISVVRPSNIYGPHDNFDKEKAMGMPALIRAAIEGQNPIVGHGDGSQIRDFLYSDDCARAMMLVMEKGYNLPVNIGTGVGSTMKEVIQAIAANIDPKPEVFFDTNKPSGDKKRVMDIERIKSLGWKPEVSLEEGIRRTINWYRKQR